MLTIVRDSPVNRSTNEPVNCLSEPPRLPGLLGELYEITRGLGGVISGEHGIGHKRKKYLPMVVEPEALALIDRHYNSLIPYRPNRPNLYAVRHGAHLTLRYVDFVASRLVLRPHNIAFPVDLLEVDSGEPPSELLAGRIALILNEP